MCEEEKNRKRRKTEEICNQYFLILLLSYRSAKEYSDIYTFIQMRGFIDLVVVST